MRSRTSTFVKGLLLVVGVMIFSSCYDQHFEEMMGDYCKCISAARNNPSKESHCRSIMDSIKKTYKGQPEKLSKVIERAGECY